MSTDTIEVAAVQETDFGEKVVIDSPFEAKDYIKFLPWEEYASEVSEHGSLKGKAESRGTNVKSSDMLEIFDAMEQYGFPDDFATHVSWDPDALNGEGAWTIDREAAETAKDFWEFCGFTVEVETDL